MSIRKNYEKYGVDKYYKVHAESYTNYHFDQIRNLLINNKDKIKNNKILDLCCGHGEVTNILLDLGYNNITGCDPYTSTFYKTKTNKKKLEEKKTKKKKKKKKEKEKKKKNKKKYKRKKKKIKKF